MIANLKVIKRIPSDNRKINANRWQCKAVNKTCEINFIKRNAFQRRGQIKIQSQNHDTAPEFKRPAKESVAQRIALVLRTLKIVVGEYFQQDI